MGWDDTIFSWLGFARFWAGGPRTPTDGAIVELQANDRGHLKVEVASITHEETAWSDPIALAADGIVKTAPGKLYQLIGFSGATSEQYLQFFDAASVPTAGAAPKVSLRIPGGANFSLELPRGRHFYVGVVWALSSQPDRLQPTNDPSFWVNAEFA